MVIGDEFVSITTLPAWLFVMYCRPRDLHAEYARWSDFAFPNNVSFGFSTSRNSNDLPESRPWCGATRTSTFSTLSACVSRMCSQEASSESPAKTIRPPLLLYRSTYDRSLYSPHSFACVTRSGVGARMLRPSASCPVSDRFQY